MYDDNAPFEIQDYEVGDLTDQSGGDVIEAFSKVRFLVKKATVRPSKDGSSAKLSVQAQVGPIGVDGNGKYAKKVIFQDLLFWFDKDNEKYQSDWWKTQARYPFTTFLKALGYSVSPAPKVNDSFLTEIVGKEFVANILKKEQEVKDPETGKYIKTGEYRNELSQIRKAE